MTQAITQVKARAQATVLSKFLAGIGRKVSFGQALDAVSVLSGAKSWNVFCAANPVGTAAPVRKSLAVAEPVADAMNPRNRTSKPTRLLPAVTAQVYTDDRVTKATFDIRNWLSAAASAQTLANLISEEWSHCYEADSVAEFHENLNSDVEAVFTHLHNMSADTRGFECVIDGTAVLAWLKLNMRDMFDNVLRVRYREIVGAPEGVSSADMEKKLFDNEVSQAVEKVLAESSAGTPATASHSLLKAMDVCMLDIVGDYDTPDTVPEWDWVRENATFSHRGNNQWDGVYEFMVNVECIQSSHPAWVGVPELLKPLFDQAISKRAVWVLFHQG